MDKSNQRGQILLVVVLSMIVALTVGLSIAARIVTELKLSKQNEESQRAFQAAESGIQLALSRSDSVSDTFDNNSKVSANIQLKKDVILYLNNGIEVDQIVGADVWLSDYSSSSDTSLLFANPMGQTGASAPYSYSSIPITLYWGSPDQTECTVGSENSTAPAIEVVLLKGPKINPTIQRNIYEASSCGRIAGATASGTGTYSLEQGGQQFAYSAPLKFDGNDLSHGFIMRVIPIYNSTIVALQSTSDPVIQFPAQGAVVESTGSSGDTVRKVQYFQSFPQLPIEIFPYTKISQ